MADPSGSRKHKWSNPPEMSPSKYLRGLDSKLPTSPRHSRERDSESLSPPRERQVTIYTYESTPKRSLNLGTGGSSTERAQSRGHRRTTSLDYHGSNQQMTSTPRTSTSGGDRQVQMNEDTKARSEDVPRSRERRLHAPSLLFKRAFSDILGVSPRERRSLDGQATNPPDAERTSRLQRRESKGSEPSPRRGSPEKQIEEQKPLQRRDSADHPIRLHRTITREFPKEEPEVCKERSKGSEPLPKTDTSDTEMAEDKSAWRSDGADHPVKLRRTITRVLTNEEPEVRKGKSRDSEPLPRTGTSKSIVVDVKPSRRSGDGEHPVVRQGATRAVPKEEPEVLKGKPKDSEPSPRTVTPKSMVVDEKPSRKSGGGEHPVRLRRGITEVVPKKEPEVHKEKSRDSKPSPRTGNSNNEEVKPPLRSESGDHPIRLKGTIDKAVSEEQPEVHKVKSRVSEPSRRTGTSKNEEVKSSRRSESGDHPIRRKETIEKAVPEEEPEVHKSKSRVSEPSRRTGTSKNEEVKSSRRSESGNRPVGWKGTIEKAVHEEEPEVHKEEPEAPSDIPRLVFLYESDKESDTGDHPEKDPSIGSDFSDVEDMGTLARFSQEDAPLQDHPAENTSAGTPTPSYLRYPPQMYSRSFNSYTDPWPASPIYKPSAEQNKWRQDDLNKSCVSEVSLNTECSHMTSSDSEDEAEKRRERSESFNTRWSSNDNTKAPRRTLDIPPAADSNTPKFLREGFIDTHCHLDMLFARLQHRRSFADLREQYSSTFPSEFQGCITDYCDPRTLERLPWRHVLNEDLVWGAFGCHPHFAQYYTNALQEEMMQAMRHPKAIAYGEMGLDYSHKCSTTIPDQHAVFEKQLKLAVPLGKPLVIHCRDADEDLFRIMKKWVPCDYKIHRHCFTGSYKVIEPFLQEFPNMSVGFTAVLTYPSAANARDAVTRIPLDRLIIETDAPFFVPRQVPKTLCKFSHPGLALHTVQEVARLKNLPMKSVMAKVRENTHRLYNI